MRISKTRAPSRNGVDQRRRRYTADDVLICVTLFRPNFKPLCRRLNLRIRIVPMSFRVRGAIRTMATFSRSPTDIRGLPEQRTIGNRSQEKGPPPGAHERSLPALWPEVRLFSAVNLFLPPNSVLVHNLHPSPLESTRHSLTLKSTSIVTIKPLLRQGFVVAKFLRGFASSSNKIIQKAAPFTSSTVFTLHHSIRHSEGEIVKRQGSAAPFTDCHGFE
jgi:hypothetical protein